MQKLTTNFHKFSLKIRGIFKSKQKLSFSKSKLENMPSSNHEIKLIYYQKTDENEFISSVKRREFSIKGGLHSTENNTELYKLFDRRELKSIATHIEERFYCNLGCLNRLLSENNCNHDFLGCIRNFDNYNFSSDIVNIIQNLKLSIKQQLLIVITDKVKNIDDESSLNTFHFLLDDLVDRLKPEILSLSLYSFKENHQKLKEFLWSVVENCLYEIKLKIECMDNISLKHLFSNDYWKLFVNLNHRILNNSVLYKNEPSYMTGMFKSFIRIINDSKEKKTINLNYVKGLNYFLCDIINNKKNNRSFRSEAVMSKRFFMLTNEGLVPIICPCNVIPNSLDTCYVDKRVMMEHYYRDVLDNYNNKINQIDFDNKEEKLRTIVHTIKLLVTAKAFGRDNVMALATLLFYRMCLDNAIKIAPLDNYNTFEINDEGRILEDIKTSSIEL